MPFQCRGGGTPKQEARQEYKGRQEFQVTNSFEVGGHRIFRIDWVGSDQTHTKPHFTIQIIENDELYQNKTYLPNQDYDGFPGRYMTRTIYFTISSINEILLYDLIMICLQITELLRKLATIIL